MGELPDFSEAFSMTSLTSSHLKQLITNIGRGEAGELVVFRVAEWESIKNGRFLRCFRSERALLNPVNQCSRAVALTQPHG